jgi:hypothetical protein
MTDSENHHTWKDTIEELHREGKLKSHQCIVYSKRSRPTTTYEKCGCQRLVRLHSYDGRELDTKPDRDSWNVKSHTQPLTTLIHLSTQSTKVSKNSILYSSMNS